MKIDAGTEEDHASELLWRNIPRKPDQFLRRMPSLLDHDLSHSNELAITIYLGSQYGLLKFAKASHMRPYAANLH